MWTLNNWNLLSLLNWEFIKLWKTPLAMRFELININQIVGRIPVRASPRKKMNETVGRRISFSASD